MFLQQAAAWRLYTRVVGIKTHSLEQDGEMEFEKKKQTNFSLSSYVSGLTWLLFPQRWWKNGSPSPVAVIGSFRAGVLKETKNKPRCRQVRCRINAKKSDNCTFVSQHRDDVQPTPTPPWRG